MSKRRDGKFQIDRLNYEHAVFREVLRAIVITSTTAETIQPSDYEGLDEAINQLIPDFTVEMGNFLPAKLLLAGAPVALEASSLIAVGRGTRRENLASAVRLYFPRILDEMIQGVSRAVSSELARLQYLGPFVLIRRDISRSLNNTTRIGTPAAVLLGTLYARTRMSDDWSMNG